MQKQNSGICKTCFLFQKSQKHNNTNNNKYLGGGTRKQLRCFSELPVELAFKTHPKICVMWLWCVGALAQGQCFSPEPWQKGNNGNVSAQGRGNVSAPERQPMAQGQCFSHGTKAMFRPRGGAMFQPQGLNPWPKGNLSAQKTRALFQPMGQLFSPIFIFPYVAYFSCFIFSIKAQDPMMVVTNIKLWSYK